MKDKTSPAHDLFELGLIPSPLSCVQMRPAPPVNAHAPFPLPAETTPNCLVSPGELGQGFALSYSGHSHQSWLLNHRLTKPAPDTTPAAKLLARLFLSFTTAVTLVGFLIRALQVCPRLPPRHSFEFHGELISEGRIQKRPLIHPD